MHSFVAENLYTGRRLLQPYVQKINGRGMGLIS